MLKFSVDCGKSAVKLALKKANGELYVDTFPFVVNQGHLERFDNNVHHVTFNSTNYTVGDDSKGFSKEQFETTDKLSNENKVAIYTAIAKMMKEIEAPFGSNISLATNVPLVHFKNEAKRSEYAPFFEKNNISIAVDGVNYQFSVKEVTPAYESIGYALNNAEELRGSETILFDFGSLNFTYTMLDENLRPNVAKSGGLRQGSHIILNEVNRKLQESDYSYSNNDITKIIQGVKNCKDEAKQIIDTTILNYLRQEIFGKLAHLDFNEKVRMTGGSSLLFSTYLNEIFKDHDDFKISNNCCYDNAVGFLELLED